MNTPREREGGRKKTSKPKESASESVVFTGSLSMERDDAAKLATACGFAVRVNVSRKTTALVTRNGRNRNLAEHEKTTKYKRAEQLMAEGYPVQIISEKDFLDMAHEHLGPEDFKKAMSWNGERSERRAVDKLRPGADLSFKAVDVETANVRNRGSICQIGIARVEDGEITNVWETTIDPEEPFDSTCVGVHGITGKDVEGAPTLPAMRQKLGELLDGSVVVCYTSFDETAFRRAFEKYGLKPLEVQWLDCAMVARRAWPERYGGSNKYGLGLVARDLGIEFGHHDAAEDAVAAAKVLVKACKHTGNDIPAWLDRIEGDRERRAEYGRSEKADTARSATREPWSKREPEVLSDDGVTKATRTGSGVRIGLSDSLHGNMTGKAILESLADQGPLLQFRTVIYEPEHFEGLEGDEKLWSVTPKETDDASLATYSERHAENKAVKLAKAGKPQWITTWIVLGPDSRTRVIGTFVARRDATGELEFPESREVSRTIQFVPDSFRYPEQAKMMYSVTLEETEDPAQAIYADEQEAIEVARQMSIEGKSRWVGRWAVIEPGRYQRLDVTHTLSPPKEIASPGTQLLGKRESWHKGEIADTEGDSDQIPIRLGLSLAVMAFLIVFILLTVIDSC